MKIKILVIVCMISLQTINLLGSTFINKSGVPLKAIASRKNSYGGPIICKLGEFTLDRKQTLNLPLPNLSNACFNGISPVIQFSGTFAGVSVSSRDEQYSDSIYNIYIANDNSNLQVCNGDSGRCDDLMRNYYGISPK